MKSTNQLRFLIIAAVIGISVFIIYQMPITLGLDLQGGTRLVLEARETKSVKVTEDAVAGALAVIRNRIDALGVTEPLITRKGRSQIIIELPGVKDPERAIRLIGETALLEFKEAEWAPGDESVLPPKKVKEFYGEDAYLEIVKEYRGTKLIRQRPIILKKTILTGADLKGSWPGIDQYGNPVVDIEFTPDGAKGFASVTTRSVGKPIAILLDKKIISAPNVREPIPSGKAQISGDFTIEEVQDLVIKLKAGALPVPVEIVENKIIGPTLGKDSIDKSKVAGIIGLAFILFFMVAYYRLPGLLADIALTIYCLVVLAVLSLINTTLTLPGIAGFLLSIGMAVDANIIIFERLKEELRLGKTIRLAIETSFKRAITTILDANITTLIAAATLFWLGTGTIKGFAITLSIGIVVSMLTAILVTRMMMEMAAGSGILKTESKMVLK
ncbi:protein translocase subunit SecD [Candidatus Margulisiibacteriota bacterium]